MPLSLLVLTLLACLTALALLCLLGVSVLSHARKRVSFHKVHSSSAYQGLQIAVKNHDLETIEQLLQANLSDLSVGDIREDPLLRRALDLVTLDAAGLRPGPSSSELPSSAPTKIYPPLPGLPRVSPSKPQLGIYGRSAAMPAN